MVYLPQRDKCTLFYVIVLFSPQPPRQCLSPVISLLLTNTVSPVRGFSNHMMGEVSWDPKRKRTSVGRGRCTESVAPSIRSHRGTKVVWPDFQPMRVPEEPVCIDLFRQNPVFTSLYLKSLVHVVPPLSYVSR
jgi:hypothetical protein